MHPTMNRLRAAVMKMLPRAVSLLAMLAVCLGVFGYTADAQSTYVIDYYGQVTGVVADENASVTDVLQQAGFSLNQSDVVTTSQEGDVNRILVKPLDLVTVSCDGEVLVVQAQDQTVQDVLDSLGITPGPEDRLSASLDETVTNGMHIRLTRVSTQTMDQVYPIHFGTMTTYDDTLPAGTTQLVCEGQDGQRYERWEIRMEDGVEVSRKCIGSGILSQSVNEQVLIGTWEGPDKELKSATRTESQLDTPMPQPPANSITTPDGRVLIYSRLLSCETTAYTCEGSSWNTTATGTTARYGEVAVDPSVIPLGSTLYIFSDDGYCNYGVCTAEDTGGDIKGNRIDLYFDTYDTCIQFGRRQCSVYVIEDVWSPY